MNNEILKYDNELNEVPFRKFNNRELDMFFGIISRLRDKGTEKVTFSFKNLKNIIDYKGHGTKQFIDDLENLYNKLIKLTIWRKNEHVSETWVLFTYYKIDKDNKNVTIAVNPDMQYILNNLARWTRFSLRQFVELDSTYSKTAFRLLKQYRTSGKRYFSMEEFKTLFDVAKSYKASDIDKRVLKPIREELTPYFRGLGIRKKKAGSSGKIVGYSFTWHPEIKNKDDFSKGAKKDFEDMLNNINMSSELSKKDKKEAIKRLLGKYNKKKDINPNKIFSTLNFSNDESNDLFKKDEKENINIADYKDERKRRTMSFKEYLKENS